MLKSLQRLILSISTAVIGCLGLLGLLAWKPVYAAAITVNSTADTIASDGFCTLREAVQAANTDTAVNECPAGTGNDNDTIAITVSGSIWLNSPLTITANLKINGPGAALLAIDGQGNGRIFNVAAGALTLTDLTIQNGHTTGDGGGIYAATELKLTHVNILTNTAWGYGGGVYVGGSLAMTNTQFISNTAGGSGGGADVRGAAALTGGLFQDNRASFGGGGLNVYTLTLTNTQFIHNLGGVGNGGGVNAGFDGVVNNGVFQNNHADYDGGGLYANGNLTLVNTQFFSNSAAWNGGGLYGWEAITVTGGLFQNNRSQYLYADGGGGGLFARKKLAMTGAQFVSNRAVNGGGLYARGWTTSTVVNALFARNQAGGHGDALYLHNPFGGGGTMNIYHTTIASPTLTGGSAIYAPVGTVGIFNSIIASHTVDIELQPGALVDEDYNLFDDTAVFSGTGVFTGGHSLVGSPAFLNPLADDYHLTAASPAINSGMNLSILTDFENGPRPFGGTAPDIGCDETHFAPTAVPDTLTLPEDAGGQTIAVLLNDSDDNGDAFSLTAVSTPDQGGTAVFSAQTITYTPAADFFGSEHFIYTLANGGGLTGTAVVTAAVTPVNDAPTLSQPGNRVIAEDAAIQTVTLSGIGAGPNENQTLSVTAVSTHTSLIPHPVVTYASPNAGGSLSFIPAADGFGTAVIVVTVSDGFSQTARSFQVTVNPVNDPPQANDDAAATPEDTPVTISVLANDDEPQDGPPLNLTVIGVTAPANGTAVTNGSAVIYTPTLNFIGSDVFDYTISDGGGLTDTAVITVTIGGVNDPPQAQADQLTIAEDTPAAIDVLSNDSDPDGQIPVITAVTPPAHGTAVIVSSQIIYTPTLDYSGADNFAYTISDGALTDTAAVTITISPVNDLPTLNQPGNRVVDEDAGLQTVNLSGIGSGAANENQVLSVTAVSTNPALIPHPAVTYASPNASGSLRFTPTANGFGSATINVTVSDGVSQTARSFLITVNPVNDPPTLAQPSNRVMDEDAGLQTVNLSGIGMGAANENQTVSVTAVSTNPALIPHPAVAYASPNASGSLTFTPVADGFGSVTINVTVSDGLSQTTGSFLVTVNPVNDPPTLNPLTDLLLSESAGLQTVNLSGIGSGAANEHQTLTVTAVSTHTALIPHPTIVYTSPNASGSLRFTPVVSQVGQAAVVVTVSDGLSHTSRAFRVSVNTLPLTVQAAQPGRVIAANGIISATFSRPPASSSVTTRTFTIWGGQTGVYHGSYSSGSTVQFDAFQSFKPGEQLLVNLSSGIQTGNGVPLAPYAWQLRTAVSFGGALFTDSGQSLGRFTHQKGAHKTQSILDSQGAALADLDGDGDLDVFIAINGAANQVWFNDGGGQFSDSGQRLGDGRSWAVALGDLDGDGDLDAFVANYGAGDTIWWNDGGQFSDSGQQLGSADTYAAALGDLNGDGRLDIVTGSDLGQANRVWLNGGGGQFSPGQALGYADNRAVSLGDLDGDGDLDVWAGNSDGRANLVWWNDGGARFSDSGQTLGSGDTYAAALGDLDGDGDLDAFTGNMNGEPNRVWLNDGGGFSDSGQALGQSASWSAALGDLDGDGDLDAFVGNVAFGQSSTPTNTVWLNDGNGRFAPTGQALGSGDSWAVSLGDVDDDGDLDAFVGNSDRLNQANKLWLNLDPSQQTVAITIHPGQKGSLVFTDGQNSQTIVAFPAGVVSQTTEFRLTPIFFPARLAGRQAETIFPPGLGFANHAFVLEAYRNDVLLPDLTLTLPLTITIGYTELDIAEVREETLGLRYWNDNAWANDGITPISHDTDNNRLTVTTTHLAQFALLGQNKQQWLYLPLVAKP